MLPNRDTFLQPRRVGTGLTNLLLVVSGVLFVLGLFTPLLTVTTWFVFADTLSLVTALGQLWRARHYLLFAVILAFSLLLPLAKILLIALVCNAPARTQPRLRATLHWLAVCGKWSMLDVFVVALLVVVGQVRALAEVQVHYGLYVFTASVLTIHAVTCRLDTLVQRAAPDAALQHEP